STSQKPAPRPRVSTSGFKRSVTSRSGFHASPSSRASLLRQLLDRGFEVLVYGGGLDIEDPAVAVVFAEGLLPCLIGGDFAGVGEEIVVAELEEVVELGGPIGHAHGALAAGLEFGEFQVGG